MTRSCRLLPCVPWRAAVAAFLALALVLAGTLGLVHASVHGLAVGGPGGGEGYTLLARSVRAAHATQLAREAPGHDHAHGAGLLSMFDMHDDGSNQCRLYDQLASAAALPAPPVLVLPLVLPSATFHFFLGEALARWVALFDARGPPASR